MKFTFSVQLSSNSSPISERQETVDLFPLYCLCIFWRYWSLSCAFKWFLFVCWVDFMLNDLPRDQIFIMSDSKQLDSKPNLLIKKFYNKNNIKLNKLKQTWISSVDFTQV